MNIVVLGAGTAGLITALIIHEKYPLFDITIVKSSEIGIIGVGEGSTEHWSDFINFVGINHTDLIQKAKATIKIGILFKNWNLDSEYVHSVFFNSITSLQRPDLYYALMDIDNKFPLSPSFEKSFYRNFLPFKENFLVSNQYHFDTFALNSFLQTKCKERGISIIDLHVDDVEVDTNGNVKSISEDHVKVKGDFFIDCSGFKRIISSKLGVKWKSMGKYLPMNHAIAFPTELDDYNNIEPYTLSEAYDYGWVWKIPTQERYGNGYVFCDNYISPDQALGEINKKRKIPVEKFAKDIKFEAGRIDKFWINNVLSVGLSSSFAEPLEAQSIGFSIIQANSFINYLDRWEFNKNVSNYYNNEMNKCFDNIIDYLQLHYLTKREDTKFWKDKPFELTDFLEENLTSMKNGIIDPSMFSGGIKMFTVNNFLQVLHGLEIFDKSIIKKLFSNNRQVYNTNIQETALREYNNSMSQRILSHRQFLDLVILNNKFN